MVLEHALISVRADVAGEFEEALGRARSIIAGCPGFVSLTLQRGIESPERYLLLVEWETLDDHIRGFRQSEAFTEWRALIGPYFASDPVVDHFVPVEGLGR
jgi:heme-degrading monooxygenase HmoA